MAVTIKLKCKGKGIETHPKHPQAWQGEVVRWECDEGPWFVVFKSGAGPLYQPGLNGGKGNANGKGSKVKVKGPKKYYYAVAIWDGKAFCTADPPLDIVPRGSVTKSGRKRSRKAKKRSRANR